MQKSHDDLKTISDHSRIFKDEYIEEVGQLYELYDNQNGTVSKIQHDTVRDLAQRGLRNAYDKCCRNGRHEPIKNELCVGIQKCPMCGVGNASTLDHYLEKNEYKALSMMRQNLVPMCYDCNTKRNHNGLGAKDFIHAYYDNLPEDRQWLKVDLTFVEGSVLAKFYPDPAVLTDLNLFRKAAQTIEKLELNDTIGKELHSFLSSLLTGIDHSDDLIKIFTSVS